MKKKLISGLFLMLWMALLIAAMVYPQGIFPVLAASGVWVACLLTWAVIPVALAALIKNGPLWQELRASLLKTITRKENVFISWVMRLLIVVSLAWTESGNSFCAARHLFESVRTTVDVGGRLRDRTS